MIQNLICINNYQFKFFVYSFSNLRYRTHSKLGLYFQLLQSFCFILITSNRNLDLFISATSRHVPPSTVSISPVVSSCQIFLLPIKFTPPPLDNILPPIKVNFPSLDIILPPLVSMGRAGPGSQVDVAREKYSDVPLLATQTWSPCRVHAWRSLGVLISACWINPLALL